SEPERSTRKGAPSPSRLRRDTSPLLRRGEEQPAAGSAPFLAPAKRGRGGSRSEPERGSEKGPALAGSKNVRTAGRTPFRSEDRFRGSSKGNDRAGRPKPSGPRRPPKKS